jgi:hypothetical protein
MSEKEDGQVCCNVAAEESVSAGATHKTALDFQLAKEKRDTSLDQGES